MLAPARLWPRFAGTARTALDWSSDSYVYRRAEGPIKENPLTITAASTETGPTSCCAKGTVWTFFQWSKLQEEGFLLTGPKRL